jgi:hypothetical protein
MRNYSNKEHLRERFEDKELFKSTRLQTWFIGARQRYWTVDESKELAQQLKQGAQEQEQDREPELELELSQT